MNAETCLPPDLQPVADAVLRDFAAGVEEPDGLTRICEWLEIEGWDFLIADLGEQNALKLGYIAQLEFSDEEARYNLDIPEEVEIQDADRLSWARQRINVSVPRTHIEKSFSSIQDLVLLDSGWKDESFGREIARQEAAWPVLKRI